MENLYIRPLSEADLDAIISMAGGKRAHPDADRRDKPGADYVLGEAVIELKALDDEGLSKPERQAKLAALFRSYEPDRPVIVLDRAALPEQGQRDYDRMLERPVANAVRGPRAQLKQSRSEFGTDRTTVLFVINNGNTALDHDALLNMVAHRVRNDTREIDGVVVGGCYFYSDTFDHFFIWPLNYLPINVERPFTLYETLRTAWGEYANRFMTDVIQRPQTPDAIKGPVVDSFFDVDGVTYVKPAPPMGRGSDFFANGRPRKNSSGITQCPPVAITFPDMTAEEWKRFRAALPYDHELFRSYGEWLRERATAVSTGTALKPLVPIPVTCKAWRRWRKVHRADKALFSVKQYANELFEQRIRTVLSHAREGEPSSFVPSRYILVLTEEIGQDLANDVSHIAAVRETPGAGRAARPLVSNARMFHDHALVVACAYAVAKGIESVFWVKDQRYAWI